MADSEKIEKIQEIRPALMKPGSADRHPIYPIIQRALQRYWLPALEERVLASYCATRSTRATAAELNLELDVVNGILGRPEVKEALSGVERAMQDHLWANAQQVNGGLAEIAFSDREEILNRIFLPMDEFMAQAREQFSEAVRNGDKEGAEEIGSWEAEGRRKWFTSVLSGLRSLPPSVKSLIKSARVQPQLQSVTVILEDRLTALRQLSQNLRIGDQAGQDFTDLQVVMPTSPIGKSDTKRPPSLPAQAELSDNLEIDLPVERGGDNPA